MDVRCERCKTEYELDESRIADAGLTVKCTQCANIFKVRKPFVTTPALDSPPQKEWRVRRQDGQQLALRNLNELQRWIVERRVGPGDEVSLSGETWRRLGTLPELGAFFELVEADQGRPLGPPPVSRDVAMGDTMVGLTPSGAADGPERSRTPAWTGQAAPMIGVGSSAPEPAWASGGAPSVDIDLDDQLSAEDLKHVQGSGGKWLIVLLLLVAAGGGGYWFLKTQTFAAPGTLPAPKMEPLPSLEPSTPMPPESAKGADMVPPPKPETPAPEVAPAPPTAPAAAPAPAAVVPAPAAPPSTPPKAATVAAKENASESNAVPAGKGINFYLGQGHHLLDSKPELALKYFAKASEIDPRSPEPDSGRGLAYNNMERWGDAVAAFQLSLKKSPEYTEALIGLAEAYRAQGTAANKRKALGLYRRYLDLAPNGPDAPVAKAQVEILESDLKVEAPPTPAPASVEAVVPDAPAEAAPPPSEPLAAPPPVLAPDNPPKPAGQ